MVLRWGWAMLLGLLLGAVTCAQAQGSFPAGSARLLLEQRALDPKPPVATWLAGEARNRPVPTNQWYSAMIFAEESVPVFAQPLSVRAAASGLEVALPVKQVIETVRKDTEIHYPHRDPIRVIPSEFELTRGRLARSGDWSIDVAMGNDSAKFDVTVARGSPYVWTRISRGGFSVQLPRAAQRLHERLDGRMLVLQTGAQVFAIFGPTGVRWEQRDDRQWRAEMPAGKDYFSIAALPDVSEQTAIRFLKHAFAFVEQTQVAWRFDELTSAVHTVFTAKTRPMEGTEKTTLLGLYPHHWHRNASVVDRLTPHQFETVRGPIRLIEGQEFSTRSTFHGFVPHWPALEAGELSEAHRGTLRELIKGDLRDARRNMLQIGNGPYWQGKGLQRVGKLLDVVQFHGEAEEADRLRTLMKDRIAQWFSGQDRRTYFQLDRRIGTVLAFPEEYYSVRQLNDHHFHYGYWIRTLAELGLREPALVSAEQWGPMVEWLIRDIATADRNDPQFPFLRHFDAYEGHSWASGVALGVLGNNQESSSEATNAWAGLILWAELTGNTALRDLGIYLYTTEIEAIRHYWFDVHDLVFAPEYRNHEVSMLFGSAYTHNTWWTDEPRQIKGINLLPITTSSIYLGLDPHHVRRSLGKLKDDMALYQTRGKQANPRDIWQDLFAKTMALTDPKAGFEMWDRWGAVELGDTRSHALHFLLSLQQMGPPDFSVTANHVLAGAFRRADGRRTYLAYNASPRPITVRFSDGQVLTLEPRSLGRAYSTTGSGSR
jgi:endoglucanase Acf2